MKLPKMFAESERLALVTGFLGAVILLFSLAPFPPMPDTPLNAAERPNLSTLTMPKALDFAGEPMPIDDPEVRKRFERELLLNLQSDGQIILYLKRSGEVFEMYDRI